MAKTDFRKSKLPFTQVVNKVLWDKKLSLKAKGLYAFLYSKPDGWDFSAIRIAKESKDGKEGVASGLRELEKVGFLLREKLPSGRVRYRLFVDPNTENPFLGTKPKPEKPKEAFCQSGETRLISNKDNKIIKSISNTSGEPSSQIDQIDDKKIKAIIDEFLKWNPAAKRFYKMKVQREACRDLILAFGFEEVITKVQSLPKINSLAYVTSAVTPLQLFERHETIQAQLRKKDSAVAEKQRSVSVI